MMDDAEYREELQEKLGKELGRAVFYRTRVSGKGIGTVLIGLCLTAVVLYWLIKVLVAKDVLTVRELFDA